MALQLSPITAAALRRIRTGFPFHPSRSSEPGGIIVIEPRQIIASGVNSIHGQLDEHEDQQPDADDAIDLKERPVHAAEVVGADQPMLIDQ